MMAEETGAPQDAAWVVIETPLSSARLAAFCEDLERLYRINPYLEFRRWRDLGDKSTAVAFRNLSNGREVAATFTVGRHSPTDFTVHYDSGIKQRTRFKIEPSGAGSRLKITEEYDQPTADSDLGEVDRSLNAWGVALHDYLAREVRWGRHWWWRWYMRRVWVPMKPSARRIVYILLVLTAAEIALFALGMAIYWIEYR